MTLDEATATLREHLEPAGLCMSEHSPARVAGRYWSWAFFGEPEGEHITVEAESELPDLAPLAAQIAAERRDAA